MPRIAVPVDRDELQTAVYETERTNGGPFENRNRLFHAVANGEWARDHGFSHSLITLRFNQFELACQTPLGRVFGARKTEAEDPSEMLAMVTHATDADAGLADTPSRLTQAFSDAADIEASVPITVGASPATDGDFFGPFTRRGIVVKTLADLTPAASKSDKTNWAISEAWKEVRTNAGLDKADWEAIESRKTG